MDDQSLTTDSSVGAVIAAFAQDAGGGRELRAALSHIDAELGTMPVRNVRTRHLAALLDDLETAGISPRRETAVIDALDAVFAFARARGLIATDPLAGALDDDPAPERHDPWPRDEPQPAPAPSPVSAAGPATATATMVALGARVATWAAVAIVVVFFLLMIALIAELA
jgi:hypothetical protein